MGHIWEAKGREGESTRRLGHFQTGTHFNSSLSYAESKPSAAELSTIYHWSLLLFLPHRLYGQRSISSTFCLFDCLALASLLLLAIAETLAQFMDLL